MRIVLTRIAVAVGLCSATAQATDLLVTLKDGKTLRVNEASFHGGLISGLERRGLWVAGTASQSDRPTPEVMPYSLREVSPGSGGRITIYYIPWSNVEVVDTL